VTALPPPVSLGPLQAQVAAKLGLDFPETRWPDLWRGCAEACASLGVTEPEAWLQELETRALLPAEVEALAKALTVGETYFFREPAAFAALERHIFPALFARGAGAMVWSAGCCTGEEAYSLAIVAARCAPGDAADELQVLGTDLNPRFLDCARAARYRPWSLRATDEVSRQRDFVAAPDGTVSPRPEVHRRVSFRLGNLVAPEDDAGVPSRLADVVFCRNVLMYFGAAQQRVAVARLVRHLRPGGWLFVSGCEAAPGLFPELERVELSGTIAFRRPIPSLLTSSPAPVAAATPSWSSREFSPPLPWAVDPGAAPAGCGALPFPGASEPAWTPGPGTPDSAATAPAAAPDLASAADSLETARHCAGRGDLRAAAAAVQRALALDRTNPAAHYLHALVLQELEDPEGAKVALRGALYCAPDFVLAHYRLALLLRASGERRRAKRHLTAALELIAEAPEGAPLAAAEGLSPLRLADTVRALLAEEDSA